jgi:hypothetical protein
MFMLMRLGRMFRTGMDMLVGAVFAGVLMVVNALRLAVLVGMGVVVAMGMAVHVRVLVGVLADAGMLVFVLMLVGMLMDMVVVVFMIALHGEPPFVPYLTISTLLYRRHVFLPCRMPCPRFSRRMPALHIPATAVHRPERHFLKNVPLPSKTLRMDWGQKTGAGSFPQTDGRRRSRPPNTRTPGTTGTTPAARCFRPQHTASRRPLFPLRCVSSRCRHFFSDSD